MRITCREDLKTAHEPSHRLLKIRTVVLERQFGRAYTAALAAFKRVQTFCAKIAEYHQRLEEKDKEGEVTGPNLEDPSNSKPTLEKTRSEQDDGKLGDDLDGTTAEVNDVEGTSQDLSGDDSQGSTQARDDDPPSCGRCMGYLSFPCWYCTKCEGQS